MNNSALAIALALPLLTAVCVPAAASTYLNNTNITVAVGPGTSAGTFNNTFDSGRTIGKVIDAPSAGAEEFHDQATHIWFTADQVGGGLELRFDFGARYDISTLHFWNYTEESYDVDDISFSFYSASNALVGSLAVSPELGSSPGIRAQNIVLAAPLNVQYVTAVLSGTNRQVDFQNIGFTADVSAPIPEPGTFGLIGLGALALAAAHRRRARAARPA
jgi:hypothetical protein